MSCGQLTYFDTAKRISFNSIQLKLRQKMFAKKAFSLIELSFVILIIGIVMIGITQSSRLVNQFKLSSARSQTKNSPIDSIPSLAAWFETTREESFNDSEAADSSYVSTWYDVNSSSNNKHPVTSTTPPTTSPLYIANCINGLPCLRFDGFASFLTFGDSGGSFLTNSDYTIFVVEQRRSGNQGFFFGSSYGSMTSNDRVMLGYSSSTSLLYSHDVNDYSLTVSYAASNVTAKLHSFRFAQAGSGSRTYFINGAQSTLSAGTGADPTAPITSFRFAAIGYSIGSGYSGYFNGDIAEIIIYTRALNDVERGSVEGYLKKKWAIS